MKSISEWKNHRKSARLYAAVGEDDSSLERSMRVLAIRMHASGRTALRLPARAMRELKRLAERMSALRAEGDALTERLSQELRLMEACAGQARSDAARDMPAADGRARAAWMADALCLRGELRLNRERLMLAVSAVNEIQPLEMAELWAVPEALRIATVEGFLRLAGEIADYAGEREAARRWAAGEGTPQGSDAFCEHALQLLSESDESEKIALLEREAARRGTTLERMVESAHNREALLRMRLENLAANRRLIAGLDWRRCFEELSEVEAELCYDPTDIYARMDEESRQAVRRETALLARRAKLGEVTIARHAVRAAQAAVREGEPEARRTVCWWLYDDEGRAALMRRIGAPGIRLPQMVPDADGRRCVLGLAILAGLILALFGKAVERIWLLPLGIPLAWGAATALVGRFFPHWTRPGRLLKLEINRVPDQLRTLVVMPALLSSPKRAAEVCAKLEALGCLERDENIRYLLLGDFADAEAEHADGDEAVAQAARREIARMNDRAGEEKYFYLHRGRELLKADEKWMGRDRKRGALMALNRLLLGEEGAQEAFSVESCAAEKLRGRYRYVLTADCDTRFLPDAARRLIGALAHPLNASRAENGVRRGYAVLQPQMELAADACVNRFVRLFAGAGGANAYPTSISNFWQDLTGRGGFGGKGLYDVRAFQSALDGALPEGRILSHDLIEGLIAGAAVVSDVTFYDEFPATLGSLVKRQNRWTRGDWQLLPLLFSARRYPPDGERLSAAARTQLLDNLLRSLWAPALISLLTQAVWLGAMELLSLGLLFAFLAPILHLTRPSKEQWRRALAELMLLPVFTACAGDAILRTLWRLAFTKKHLMDWVTSADAEGLPGGTALPGRIAALLLLPGVLNPSGLLAAISLSGLFLVTPEWIRDMEQSPMDAREPLGREDRAALQSLAGDVWRFFETYVDEENHFLPPDNVQIDPDVGAARRTSPTNIGLYMMSAVSARKLGLISAQEAHQRMEETTQTLERMEKWRGHLYNWYATDTLAPLHPKYVSSVDSGNLAAALLLCAADAETDDASLAGRMRALAEKMDFAALYDSEKNLFVIGFDAEHERFSQSHYDLLASEARILSTAALMLGKVPLKHWSKLSRPCADVEGRSALISWSGTMFEYLMPEIWTRAPRETLIGQTVSAAVDAQRRLGERLRRPWGVSESGYYAFDLSLNYQYRAFGLRALALGGTANEEVVAPYAAALALAVAPTEACKNLRQMEKLGWRGEYGFYEAADYQHAWGDGTPRIVRSYMAHHQGMALCAVCNALTDDALAETFARMPEARAVRLLTDEKPTPRVRLRARPVSPNQERRRPENRDERMARPEKRIVDAHLLGGAGATVLLTADGAAHYVRNGVMATRFDGDLLNRRDAARTLLLRENTGEEVVLGAENLQYAPGGASAVCMVGPLRCELRLSVSPEDGAMLKQISIRNESGRAESVRLADCIPVALGTPADQAAHPVFQNLFVESAEPVPGALCFTRRRHAAGERPPVLVHLVSRGEDVSFETDYERLSGRMDRVRWEMSGAAGMTLNPCSAIQCTLTLAPGEEGNIHFAMGLTDDGEKLRWIERNRAEDAPERAERLSAMQSRAMLGFLRLEAGQYHLLDRAAALLADPRLSARAQRGEAGPCGRERLWALGLSGDYPLWVVAVRGRDELPRAREALRACEFYRSLGWKLDLVLLNDYGSDYAQPVRDALSDLTACSPMNELRDCPGGVHLRDGQNLSQEDRETLRRAATLWFDGNRDFYAALREALGALERTGRGWKPMDVGENRLARMQIEPANGYGGFLADGRYAIDVLPERTTPAPWCNLLANDRFGALLTERGGGFLWNANSRSGRLTSFANDALREGWGWMLYLTDDSTGETLRLLPGLKPQTAFRAIYGAAETVYRFETERVSGEVAVTVREEAAEMRVHTTLRCADDGEYRLVGFVDWLMGTDGRDAAFLRTWSRDGACFACGADGGVGYFAAANARVRAGGSRTAFLGAGGIQAPEGIDGAAAQPGGWALEIPVSIRAQVPLRTDWVIGWADAPQRAYARVRGFYARPSYEEARGEAAGAWRARMDRLVVHTPDENVNRMMNGWLTHQTLTCRVRARTGAYQPGGAFGFRDQLQDMLALLPMEPERVRAHLLVCAARQFEDGDVMHWWHEPYLGVRTHISDDLLFLPYVAAEYVRWTGDAAVLDERVRYLENRAIPEGQTDLFCAMRPGEAEETLHEHCMRAFRRADRRGAHGLILMGEGDWNDGMNRIGAQGRGESVWLTMFMAACAERYAGIAPDAADRAWLLAAADSLRAAVEEHGWDGKWYLRAYADDGRAVGSAQSECCRIDAISQAWAVEAGLDEARCRTALDEAWKRLADEEHGLIRLLTPPFTGEDFDPGYIRDYPAGVRENGGQYTHAACWLLMAYIHAGDAARAHRALQMLLPMNHADAPEKARSYRVEPYVLAADVYDGAFRGRGGWTWYTGSAAWFYRAVLSLLGLEKRGSRVQLSALLGDWPEVSVEMKSGRSVYRLVCRADAREVWLDGKLVDADEIEMVDDGRNHEAVFPPRREEKRQEKVQWKREAALR